VFYHEIFGYLKVIDRIDESKIKCKFKNSEAFTVVGKQKLLESIPINFKTFTGNRELIKIEAKVNESISTAADSAMEKLGETAEFKKNSQYRLYSTIVVC
jgi:hypothetical protein